jgi:peptidoglycan hydrolase-like protein with peptidoglycan-binding domain
MAYRRYHDEDDDTFGLEGAWGSTAARPGFGRIEPDERLEASREAWRRGASYQELFGTHPFELKARVGNDGENNPSDVAKLQTLLDRLGFYDLQFTDGPTGLYGSDLDDSLKRFQATADLKVDGIADPGGETITSLSAGLTPHASARGNATTDTHPPTKSEATPASQDTAVARPPRVSAGTNAGNVSDGGPRNEYKPALMPARFLTPETQREFEQKSGLKLKRSSDGFELIDPTTGEPFAHMSRELTAELARDWPWFTDRIWLLSEVARQDLTRDEKRAVIDSLLPAADPEKFGVRKALPGVMRQGAKWRFQQEDRRVEALRRALYDGVDALEHEAGRDQALSRLRETLFPELYSEGRQLREILLDTLPFLGNARSYVHFENELAAAREKIEAGDWSGAEESGGLAFLNALGTIPGASTLRAVGKHAPKLVPYGEAVIAEVKFGRMARQWENLSEPINPAKLFGKRFENLAPEMKAKIGPITNWAVGAAGQDYARHWARRVDPSAKIPDTLKLPIGRRTHDILKRDFRDVVVDDVAARWAKLRKAPPPTPTPGIHQEVKTGAGTKKPNQAAFDDLANNNRDVAAALSIRSIEALRVLPSEIPAQFLVEHAESWLARSKTPKSVANELMAGLHEQIRTRDSKFRTLDYIVLLSRLSRLGATAERNVID